MLNETTALEWRNRVKSIFSEAQKNSETSTGPLDAATDVSEDPSVTDDIMPGSSDDMGGEGEEEPTITLTASLLKALLEYAEAPHDDDSVNADDTSDDSISPDGTDPVDEDQLTDGSSMSMPNQVTAAGGICEDETLPPAINADQTDSGEAGDDTLDADSTVSGDESGEDEELTADEIVQRLVDLSADSQGAPLDVDVLSTLFSASDDQGGGEDLGDNLDGNVQLPATTGDQTLAEEEGSELAKKEKALSHLETQLKSATGEDAADIKADIATVKSAIARLKTKSATDKTSAKNAGEAKASFKSDD